MNDDSASDSEAGEQAERRQRPGNDPTLDDFKKALGASGYGFQYAVIKKAHELSRAEGRAFSSWMFKAAEFPVGRSEKPIHIDFILQHAQAPMYLVAECKRVDPARANWCFVKAPFTHEDLYDARDLVFQTVTYSRTLVKAFVPEPRLKQASLPSTHLGFELRTGLKGDGGGSAAGGAINEAATQVLRGMNGLIDQLEPGLADGVSLFVPVIFTTARLWVADGGDISLADLNTGQLPSEPWLWYTYNQSPALRHHVPSGGAPSLSLSKILRAEFARSIAVVGPDGIEPFLRADLATWLA